MTSSGQATDLSMDEILASIRKIISEDPKPAPAVRPHPGPAVAGLRSASQIMTGRPSGEIATEAGSHAGRTANHKPALDDDILDLMDEDRGEVARTAVQPQSRPPAQTRDTAVPLSPPAAQHESVAAHAITMGDATVPAAKPASPTGGEMWSPREWSRPSENATIAEAPGAQVQQAKPAKAAAASDAPEMQLEAAIAALGQSLATPTIQAGPALAPKAQEAPVKPVVVASAPMTPPSAGPRIDVVAVVNAATRAALAQRSADEQTSAMAFALPESQAPAQAPAPKAPATGAPKEPAAATVPSTSPMVRPAPMPPQHVAEAAQSAPAPTVVAPVPVTVAPAKDVSLADVKPAERPVRPQPAAVVAKPAEQMAASEPVKPPTPAVVTKPASVVETAVAAPAGVQTLEDTVARLLRPMLRQWLDDNMPRIVEKAFKEELAALDAQPRHATKPN